MSKIKIQCAKFLHAPTSERRNLCRWAIIYNRGAVTRSATAARRHPIMFQTLAIQSDDSIQRVFIEEYLSKHPKMLLSDGSEIPPNLWCIFCRRTFTICMFLFEEVYLPEHSRHSPRSPRSLGEHELCLSYPPREDMFQYLMVSKILESPKSVNLNSPRVTSLGGQI